MIKSMMMSALIAVCACALAQDYTDWRHRDDIAVIDTASRSNWDMNRFIRHQADELQNPDRYNFEVMLDRMPANTENALVKGLFIAHRQAAVIRHDKIVAMFPDNDENLANSSTTTEANVVTDESFRPMRMVMEEPKPHEMSYRDALDILSCNLNTTETTWLDQWWHSAPEGQKDVVVRLLKCNAARADDPIYESIYRHRTYDWVK